MTAEMNEARPLLQLQHVSISPKKNANALIGERC